MLNTPSTYKAGTTSGYRVHAVRPGTIRVVGNRRMADSLCGTIVRPKRERFDPFARESCAKCNAARRRAG